MTSPICSGPGMRIGAGSLQAQEVGVRRCRGVAPAPAGPAGRSAASASAKACGVAWIASAGAVQLAELVGIGMHVHQRLRRRRDGEQLVALRRHLRQPPADQQDQVAARGCAGSSFGLTPRPRSPRVARVVGAEQHLPPERAVHRQRAGVGESGELLHRGFRPAAAAEDRHRPLGAVRAAAAVRPCGAGARMRFGDGVGQRIGHGGGLRSACPRAARCTTGPGRPEVATWKARETSSGSARRIVDLHHPLGHACRRPRRSRVPGRPRARARRAPPGRRRAAAASNPGARCARRPRRWWRPARG